MLEDRIRVETLLEQDMSILDIMDETGITLRKIRGYEADWKADKEKKVILAMIKEDDIENTIEGFIEQVDNEEVTKGLEHAMQAAKGLKVLDVAIQSTCKVALTRANAMLSEENSKLTPNQWKTIVEGIALLYSSIFVPQGTNINIQNNNGTGGSTEIGSWKASLRP